MSNLKKLMNARYFYAFENLQRSCGHVEAVVEVKNSIIANRDTVRSHLERGMCIDCRAASAREYQERQAAALKLANDYCKSRGIDLDGVRFDVMNDGKAVEITIWLDVEQL